VDASLKHGLGCIRWAVPCKPIDITVHSGSDPEMDDKTTQHHGDSGTLAVGP